MGRTVYLKKVAEIAFEWAAIVRLELSYDLTITIKVASNDQPLRSLSAATLQPHLDHVPLLLNSPPHARHTHVDGV